jgi:hypothetical protein
LKVYELLIHSGVELEYRDGRNAWADCALQYSLQFYVVVYVNVILMFTLQESEGTYSQLVKDLVADKGKRLLININDLRRKNPVRAARFVSLAS